MGLKEYRYRPPVKYLLISLLGIPACIIFFGAAGSPDFLFAVIMVFFGILFGGICIAFALLYFRNINKGNLIIGDGFVILPGRWKAPIKLYFKEILSVGEFNTYDYVIEVGSARGIYLVERNWVKKKDFEATREALLHAFENDRLGFSPDIEEKN